MEAKLKRELGTVMLKPTGHTGGGYICEGQSYDTDSGRVFVKINHMSQAKLMFDGEMASLEAILKTDTVKVPKPVKVIELDTEGCVLVMEHLDMRGLTKYSKQLGEQLADLHFHNKRQLEKLNKEQQTVGKGAGQSEVAVVEKFGFNAATCYGFFPQLKIPEFFTDVEIVPALLHGDLWAGNVAECTEGPVIFDPSSYYGHSEYELGIAGMFGGFNSSFYSAYHDKIPKAPGFAKRNQLYQLFNYLNNWNHFGDGYRSSSISIMKNLLK
ncbi:ketosamine-3-kinase-like [Scomber scombrus]|uniref:protein-ribulosamine 3-kinase n=1 Tax=Scomber scombrus TaxID=13677 RepID=A0AAV1NYA3_SCOSC